MSDDVVTTATPMTPEKQVPVQKYRKSSSKSYPAYAEAKTAKDAFKPAATERVRVRRRAEGTFDVVVYEAIETATK